MEYFPYGDLDQYITNGITENDAIQITTELLEGLKIMHAEGFAHRDLKPQVGFTVPTCEGELLSSCWHSLMVYLYRTSLSLRNPQVSLDGG